MILLGWLIGIFIFWSIFLGIRLWYSHKKPIDTNTLMDKIQSPDQYEIAFLQGGAKLVIMLAFFNLLRSGFLKKVTFDESYSSIYHFHAIPDTDKSFLNDLEMEILQTFSEEKKFDLEKLLKLHTVEEYYQRLSQSGFIYYLKNVIDGIWCCHNLFNKIAVVFYLVAGTPPNFWVKLAIGLFIMIVSCIVIWRLIFNQRNYFDGNIITQNGKKYIALFEENVFSLPDVTSDTVFQQMISISPCGG